MRRLDTTINLQANSKNDYPERLNWDEILSIYQQAARGDLSARQAIVLKLRHLVDAQLAARGLGDDADLCQSAMIVAIETLDRRLAHTIINHNDSVFNFKNRLSSDLYGSVARLINKQQKLQASTKTADELFSLTHNQLNQTEEIVTDKNDTASLYRHIGQLATRQRLIINDLYGLDNGVSLTVNEIAHKFQIPTRHVQQMIDIALYNLARGLK